MMTSLRGPDDVSWWRHSAPLVTSLCDCDDITLCLRWRYSGALLTPLVGRDDVAPMTSLRDDVISCDRSDGAARRRLRRRLVAGGEGRRRQGLVRAEAVRAGLDPRAASTRHRQPRRRHQLLQHHLAGAAARWRARSRENLRGRLGHALPKRVHEHGRSDARGGGGAGGGGGGRASHRRAPHGRLRQHRPYRPAAGGRAGGS